ncbi:MAG: hypothetical protein LUE29_09835 [Lachnospiraceae bacterium]|nr:hypothetical protein [Lachnospiraceae bacterium]
MKKTGKIETALKNSPINYFSDLFVITMVIAWIVVLVVMIGFAVYSTIVLDDTSMWSEIANLVAVPLTAGGAIWMVKNSVQHAIANNRGERAHQDFPRVNADGEDDGFETLMEQASESEAEG